MKLAILLLLTSPAFGQGALGWTALGNGTKLCPNAVGAFNTCVQDTAFAGGLQGSLVDCPNVGRTYCTGNTANTAFLGNVKSVMQAQSGCANDTVNNRMICTGGGHNDYFGNQIYILDIATKTITRVTDPSGPVNQSGVTATGQINPDGTAVATHTQQGLVYIQNENAVVKWGLGIASGGAQTIGWWIDLNTTPPTWVQKNPLPTTGSGGGGNFVLDTSRVAEELLFLDYNENIIYRYFPASDTYSQQGSAGILMINGGTCAVWPSGKKLYCAGAKETGGGGGTNHGVFTYDLSVGSTYAATDITGTLTGCNALWSQSNPGFKWNSYSSKFVGYPGVGNSVTVFDPTGTTCSTVTYSNGPSTPIADTYGIYDLFGYFPLLGGFVVVPNALDQAYMLIIDGVPPTITNPASPGAITSGTQNTAYTFTFAASGTTPITWSITSGALPTGITLNTTTGNISGTPTVFGTFNFTIKADNTWGSPATQADSLVIAPVCLITGSTLPSGKFTQAYSQTVPTAGCSSPSFSVTAGSLPNGLTLHSGTGVIDGTPTVPGLFNFTVGVTSSNGNPSQAFSITIVPGPGVFGVTVGPQMISR